jgi:hypothetical protein
MPFSCSIPPFSAMFVTQGQGIGAARAFEPRAGSGAEHGDRGREVDARAAQAAAAAAWHASGFPFQSQQAGDLLFMLHEQPNSHGSVPSAASSSLLPRIVAPEVCIDDTCGL